MSFDKSHITVLLLGVGLGTVLSFVDWSRVKSNTENMTVATVGFATMAGGIATAVSLQPTRDLSSSKDSFKIKSE